MDDVLRNPDAILRKIKCQNNDKQKGKLKIFFGYAAGIGKTYAMLCSGHSEKKCGKNVVIGYFEPHARPETMALTKGLDAIENKKIRYNNIDIEEFNIDEALRIKPEIILVDELAHTNAVGSRHKKRYQDIQELLNAGIDVYTTVNVQHIESLNDIVSSLTGVTVKEKIPDSIFDDADEIVMVDIEPSELITRLKQGKIYKEKQAKRALENFFTMKNLTALRETALRRMADWVNIEREKRSDYLENEKSASEHILMCLSPSPSNAKVIRQAYRLAKVFHGKFTAFYVETDQYQNMSKGDIERLNHNISLAESLGAKTIISYGNDIVEQIAEYSNVAKVTKVVLGRTNTRKRFLSVKESFSERLSYLAPNLEIFVIPDAYSKRYIPERRRSYDKEKSTVKDTAGIFSMLIVTTIVSYMFRNAEFAESNIIMVYILGVLLTAMITQYRISSIVYSILGVLAFNFLFTDPVQTLKVNDPSYVITFVIMFITATISSTLTHKVKRLAKQGAKKAYRTEILLETSQKLQQSNDVLSIANVIIRQLAKLLDRNIYCYVGNPETCKIPVVFDVKQQSAGFSFKQERAVAVWTYKNNKRAGASTTTLPGAKCLYLAVRNGEKIFAVIGIEINEEKIPSFEESILFAMLNECALAFEKDEFILREKNIAVKLEQEKLRANLLRSISHDLRTPLTSISGNAGILMRNYKDIDDDHKIKMCSDIYDDSVWLINLVENLLSVTRIDNGTMDINMQPELLDDIITEALKHISRNVDDHEISVEEENDMAVVNVDAKLIMQVIINIVDNAIKYTDKGSKILLSTRENGDNIIVEISDNGRGIDDKHKDKLFAMFYTASEGVSDGRRSMGLGLALCKSIIKAHGGEIYVKDNKPCGAVFGFTLAKKEVKI